MCGRRQGGISSVCTEVCGMYGVLMYITYVHTRYRGTKYNHINRVEIISFETLFETTRAVPLYCPVAMPPSVKRRKLDHSSNIPSPPAQRGIRAFGKISKPLHDRPGVGKNQPDGSCLKDFKLDSRVSIGVNDPKRKRKLLQERPAEEDLGRDCPTSSQAEPQYAQQPVAAGTIEPSTPSLQLFSKQSTTTEMKARAPANTPTKAVCSCLETLALVPSSPSDLNVISPSLETSGTPPSSHLPIKSSISRPRRVQDDPSQLADELRDLVDLHSSFLTSLSLHYAHNGSPVPADLRVLRLAIERSWRRRRVSSDDVRRILGIQQDTLPDEHYARASKSTGVLSLSDYGSGKICIEMDAHVQDPGSRRRPLDEEALNIRFADNLMRQWNIYRKSGASAVAFISQLPLAPITLCASVSKISPLLAKGQRRLEDLKAGAIRAQQNSSKPPTSRSTSDSTLTPKVATAPARNNSLLSRIRAKQLHQSTLAPPPDQASLHRKSALQRLQEVIPVLEILTASASRSISISSPAPDPPDKAESKPAPAGTYSFTMPTLVQHLQMSLRNPIAKEDAIRCVRLLAAEVAPGWVGVREVGKVVGVTVRRGREVGREEVARRIEGLLGGLGETLGERVS